MKKMIRLTVIIAILFSFSGCGKLDVIKNYSVDSFDQILGLAKDNVKEVEATEGWSLEAPDQTASFIWSKDYSKTDLDVVLVTDAKPFLDAGLDRNKLPEGMMVEDKIIVGTNLGEDALSNDQEATPLASYKQLVNLYRSSLNYHGKLDHFGIDLGNGNVFEWAKNTVTNDKDIVFVLNPQVFKDAGVDLNNIKGWLFAKVETMDSKGKKILVDKLLKPFNLDEKP